MSEAVFCRSLQMRSFFSSLSLPAFCSAIIITSLSFPAVADVSLYDSDPVASIEEIIVTATRHEADLQSIPLSVTVLTAKQLEKLGALETAEYAGTVPGLSLANPGWGGEQHTIRGIKLDPFYPEINPVTALYLDDVPIIGSGVLGSYHADPLLVDVERVEVLRGPQGTLFGAGAMSGAIRIITAKPDVSQTEGFIDSAVSTMKDGGIGHEIHAMFNTPVVQDKAAIRVVGYLHRDSGFIDNLSTGAEDVNDKDITGGRISGEYRFSDRVRLTGRVAYQDRASDGTGFEHVGLPDRHQSSLPERLLDEWRNYAVVVDADLGFGDFVSLTSYLNRKVDATLDISNFADAAFGVSNPIWTEAPYEDHELTQEFRVTSKNDGRLLWVLGAYFQDFEQDLFQTMPAPGLDEQTGGAAAANGLPDNLFNGRYSYSLDQIAAYADVSYDLSDRLEVGVGARWFDIERDYTSDLVGLFAGEPFASGAAADSGVAPRLSVGYAVTDDVTLYASAAKGFRWGGINTPEGSNQPECLAELASLGFDGFPIGYNSDTLWSYDLGIKSRWRDDRLRLNVVAYHIDWSDMQTTNYLDCGIFFVENAGDATSEGIELELTALASDHFSIQVAAQYNDAALDNDVSSLGASAGDRVPGSPRFTGSLIANLDFRAFDRNAYVSADYQYVGESYHTFDPDVRRELPAYSLANLRVGVLNDAWSASLFVRNLFDERGIVGLEDSNLRYAVTTTTPRTIGMRASWFF